MKRGGWWPRKAPMRRTKGVNARAPMRAGLIVEQIEAASQLARAVCMVRAGAAMIARDGRKGGSPQWWGRCQWCLAEGWLQWCHIRSRGACPALTFEPLNTFAACEKCHHGRWHHKRRLEDMDPLGQKPAVDPRRAFLERIRTPEEIAWIYGPHGRRDVAAQAAANLDTLEALTRHHSERAMWPEHWLAILALVGRPELAERLND